MEQPRRTRTVHVSLVGDFDSNVTAHRAIPLALKRAGDDLGVDVRFTWHHTAQLGSRPDATLEASSGIWCVPGSPYANAAAALAAIRFARERPRPSIPPRDARNPAVPRGEARRAHGRGRFSLWTGDLGMAVYLWQCVQGTAGIPTLDYV